MNFNSREVAKTDLPKLISLVNELTIYKSPLKEVCVNLQELENDDFKVPFIGFRTD